MAKRGLSMPNRQESRRTATDEQLANAVAKVYKDYDGDLAAFQDAVAKAIAHRAANEYATRRSDVNARPRTKS
jgi:hypothetical protein